MQSEYDIILNGILEFNRPFNLSDLYYKFSKMGIVNRIKIRDILDDLCDSGHIEYSEIDNDIWVFEVVKECLF